ncbi:MAG TPA: hypothetical protein VN181_11690 [Thermoanaerobaculia bacterium]|nr:hypothetical protein [Thermoanaerobaculia bacterium]
MLSYTMTDGVGKVTEHVRPTAAPVETGRHVSCAVGGKPYADAHQSCSAATGDVLDKIEQRLNESGTGEMGLLDTIHAVAAIVREARRVIPAEPQTVQATDEMVTAGAVGLMQDVKDYDGGPSFADASEQSRAEAKAMARACLNAALALTRPKRGINSSASRGGLAKDRGAQ